MTMTQNQTLDPEAKVTRDVRLPDGSTRPLTFTNDCWKFKQAIQVAEPISEEALSGFALEEMELRKGMSFDEAYWCIVYHFVQLWQAGEEGVS